MYKITLSPLPIWRITIVYFFFQVVVFVFVGLLFDRPSYGWTAECQGC